MFWVARAVDSTSRDCPRLHRSDVADGRSGNGYEQEVLGALPRRRDEVRQRLRGPGALGPLRWARRRNSEQAQGLTIRKFRQRGSSRLYNYESYARYSAGL